MLIRNYPKTAQIVCTFPPYKGGIGNVACRYAEILGRASYLSKVLTPAYKKDSDDISEFFVVKRLRPVLKYGNAAFLPQVFSLAKEFDVIHFHYPFFGTDIPLWLATLFCKKKFKLIIHYHMDVIGLPFYLKPLTWPSKIIFSSLVRKADLVVCASLDYVSTSQIKNVYRKYAQKFREIEFGVDIERFSPLAKKTKNNNTILFVGGLDSAHYFKGLDVFLETLKRLEDKEWNLKIVGSGNREDLFKRQVKELNMENRVKFLGNVSFEDLPEIYRSSDLLVLPSINRNEAFGLVLLEAMASGIAVLSSDLSGVRKVFEDRKQGLYFKTNDQEDLKTKLKWLCENKEEVRRMGRRGRALVEKKYDWKLVEKKILKTYEDLCSK